MEEAVVFGFGGVFGDVENTLVVPFFLRRRLDGGGLVMFLHGHSVFSLENVGKNKDGIIAGCRACRFDKGRLNVWMSEKHNFRRP